jgi:hypothetical protein
MIACICELDGTTFLLNYPNDQQPPPEIWLPMNGGFLNSWRDPKRRYRFAGAIMSGAEQIAFYDRIVDLTGFAK